VGDGLRLYDMEPVAAMDGLLCAILNLSLDIYYLLSSLDYTLSLLDCSNDKKLMSQCGVLTY